MGIRTGGAARASPAAWAVGVWRLSVKGTEVSCFSVKSWPCQSERKLSLQTAICGTFEDGRIAFDSARSLWSKLWWKMFRKGKKCHSSSSSQSREISTKSKSADSSLGGLSRSSTVASLDTDSTKSSGQSNNNSDTCAEFRIKYVGAIEKLKLSEGKSLEGPLDLINYIDVAQQDGKLPFVPLEEEFIMGVSKYGIKVSTSDQYDVLDRHALYLIIRMVC